MAKLHVSKKSSISPLRLGFLVFVVAVAVLAALEATNTIRLFGNSSKTTSNSIVKVGTPEPAAINNSSEGSATVKTTAPSNPTRSIGGVVDNNSSATTSTSPSDWAVSSSGAITVKQPLANSTIRNGVVLSGSANVSQVDYYLIDNDVGVISEGTLNVVNGNFSGILQFTPHASGGRLDVYSTTTPGGPEQNEIQITVSF